MASQQTALNMLQSERYRPNLVRALERRGVAVEAGWNSCNIHLSRVLFVRQWRISPRLWVPPAAARWELSRLQVVVQQHLGNQLALRLALVVHDMVLTKRPDLLIVEACALTGTVLSWMQLRKMACPTYSNSVNMYLYTYMYTHVCIYIYIYMIETSRGLGLTSGRKDLPS